MARVAGVGRSASGACRVPTQAGTRAMQAAAGAGAIATIGQRMVRAVVSGGHRSIDRRAGRAAAAASASAAAVAAAAAAAVSAAAMAAGAGRPV